MLLQEHLLIQTLNLYLEGGKLLVIIHHTKDYSPWIPLNVQRAHSLFMSHSPLEHYGAEKQSRGLVTPRLKTGHIEPKSLTWDSRHHGKWAGMRTPVRREAITPA